MIKMDKFFIIAALMVFLITGCNVNQSGTTTETITFKGVPFDTPNVKEALQKICQEDARNAKSEYDSQDKCLFDKPENKMWLSYGTQPHTLGLITLADDGSLIEVTITGSKSEILTQVETLSSKYGTPAKKVTQVENGLGTKFDKETFVWVDKLGTRITAESMFGDVDRGLLVIESANLVVKREKEIKALEESSKNNL